MVGTCCGERERERDRERERERGAEERNVWESLNGNRETNNVKKKKNSFEINHLSINVS